MNRIFIGILLGISCLFGEVNFEHQHRFVLKKDEIGTVLINRKEATKRASAENSANEYLLKLRWTLFANEQLFLLVNYRGHPYQYIMKKNAPLEVVQLPLLNDGENRLESKVFIKIIFNDFNQSNKEAILDIIIEDNAQRIEVEYRPKKNQTQE